MEVLEDVGQFSAGAIGGVVSEWAHVDVVVLLVFPVGAPALTGFLKSILVLFEFLSELFDFPFFILDVFDQPLVVLELLAH